MVRSTSARPSGGRPAVPAKMTSSILPPRSDFAPCSPMTHARASTTFDLPEPLGPTTHVMPCSKRRVVDDAKDLKPRSVRLFRYMDGLSRRTGEVRRRQYLAVSARERQRAAPGARLTRSGHEKGTSKRTSQWCGVACRAAGGL